ncbi:TetR/AcrR family transcriptional regulator [Sphingomonas sp. SRS2]|uniref:TetR/AcrR family transcriptional regulator n=1 Tax=Sphingomonas sp. SRS2 TaxID=133190 RepID=UPI0006183FF2|nr:TetR/AcrR family transcriptional regulator [Sphingomonas sp. SRS2]KKC27613.1 hypothetical protein WP12_02445 [Sphingomonas sp. SRS2]
MPDGHSRILAAARHLFAERGFHRTAMSELAAEAKVSVGQIYRSFKNKNDIIVAIVGEDVADFLAEFDDALRRTQAGEITIEKAFELLVCNNLTESETALSFEMLAEASRNPSVAEKIDAFLTPCRVTLRALACEANKALSEHALEAAEEFLLACLFGLGHRPLSRRAKDVAATAPDIARLMVKALQG